jgi:serine/threonine protein kinase
MSSRNILQYQLGERLGVGGMGEVYKAHDTKLNRVVAMKLLPAGMSADPERRRRFMQEAHAVSALNHPNIITIYDIVEHGDTQYMVVEYLDGKTLLELIPPGGLRVAKVIRYATQIAEALCAAHAARVVHRDLKPANIMVTGNDLVKLLDFGLAKVIDWGSPANDRTTVSMLPAPLTVEGSLVGTVNYMSPEQAEGRPVDERSDIFSFGAVLYEMLTGQCAFRGNSALATLSAVIRDEVQPIRELTPEVPAELDRIVTACLAKDPEQRIQTMQEVQPALAALKRQLDSGILYNTPASGITMPPPQPKASASKALIVALVCTVGIGILGAYLWMGAHPSVPTPPQTTRQVPPAAMPPSDGSLTNDDIVKMVEAQVAPSIIISQIQSSRTSFRFSPEELIRLTKAGVPATVIEVMRDPKAKPLVAVTSRIKLEDGLLVNLILVDDIPVDAPEGTVLRFKVADDVQVDDAVVIRKDAVAIGTVVDGAKKKILGLGSKMTFRLEKVDAVDGQKVPLRVTATRRSNELSRRPVDTGARKTKDVAATSGTTYPGYVDGAKTVSVKQ